MIPWISLLKKLIKDTLKMEGDEDLMSDIMFLAVKEFDSKLRSAEGSVTAAGDIATLTANSGKDMYLARAKITFIAEVGNSGLSSQDEVVLKINGTIIETTKNSMGIGATGIVAWEYEFKNVGHKVATGEIIKLEAITLDSDITVEGFIECFEETTGETPRLAAQTQGTATITGGEDKESLSISIWGASTISLGTLNIPYDKATESEIIPESATTFSSAAPQTIHDVKDGANLQVPSGKKWTVVLLFDR